MKLIGAWAQVGDAGLETWAAAAEGDGGGDQVLMRAELCADGCWQMRVAPQGMLPVSGVLNAPATAAAAREWCETVAGRAIAQLEQYRQEQARAARRDAS